MEILYQKPGHRHLIVLVHGLNGSDDTWKGNEQRFLEVFERNPLVQHYFDIVSYTYSTTILKLNAVAKPFSLLGFFKNRPKEDLHGFNVSINQISRPLESQLRQLCNEYETISIISHSMGGLVAKSALTWMQGETKLLEKIKLFVSLSVPHLGAHLADFANQWGFLFGSNPQILDLAVFSAFTTDLTQRFSNTTPHPRLICQRGIHDLVVPEAAAIPAGVPADDVFQTQDDHFSVLLVKNGQRNELTDRIFRALRQVLLPRTSQQISVNSGLTFEAIIYVIEQTWNINVDTSFLSPDAMKSGLNSGDVYGQAPEDSLANLYKLCPVGFPRYTVKWVMGTDSYIIDKL